MTERAPKPSVLGPVDRSVVIAAERLARIYRNDKPALSAAFRRDAARYREEIHNDNR